MSQEKPKRKEFDRVWFNNRLCVIDQVNTIEGRRGYCLRYGKYIEADFVDDKELDKWAEGMSQYSALKTELHNKRTQLQIADEMRAVLVQDIEDLQVRIGETQEGRAEREEAGRIWIESLRADVPMTLAAWSEIFCRLKKRNDKAQN